MTRATILIPAHNEAAVIGRTLWYLSRGLPLDQIRVDRHRQRLHGRNGSPGARGPAAGPRDRDRPPPASATP
jgi:hypothetical protein